MSASTSSTSSSVSSTCSNAIKISNISEEQRKDSNYLKELISKQSQAIREAKSNGISRTKLEGEIYQLLSLKHYYCLYSAAPVTQPELYVPTTPAKCFKLRWFVDDTNGNILRLQWQIHNQTYITGKEVFSIVSSYTKKRFKQCAIAKIEMLEVPESLLNVKQNDEQSDTSVPKELSNKERKKKQSLLQNSICKKYSMLCANDEIRLRLTTPGPMLEVERIVTLRVTWQRSPHHHFSPASFSDLPQLQLFDFGINLCDEQYSKDYTKILDNSFGAGISQMLLLSTNLNNSKFNTDLCTYRKKSIFPTVGVHPLEAAQANMEDFPKLKSLATKAVAIGECGLDFTDEMTDEIKEKQREWFKRQLQLAIDLNKPLFVHERNSHLELLDVFAEYSTLPIIIINCFSGTESQLNTYISKGFYIGITGIICNEERGVELRKLISKVPLSKMIISTDAPYLIPYTMPKPVPRKNEPFTLPYVVETIAKHTEYSPMQLANATRSTCQALVNFKEDILFDDSAKQQQASVNTAHCAYYGPNHPTSKLNTKQKPVATETSLTKEEQTQPKLKEGERLFTFESNRYICTEKEFKILSKQRDNLSTTAFKQLLEDFCLETA